MCTKMTLPLEKVWVTPHPQYMAHEIFSLILNSIGALIHPHCMAGMVFLSEMLVCSQPQCIAKYSNTNKCIADVLNPSVIYLQGSKRYTLNLTKVHKLICIA